MSGEKTVTEAEWLACTEPQGMLASLKGKGSDRKLRLFAVACVRRVWHLLAEQAGRSIVERVESHVDGRGRRPSVAVGGTGPDPRETAEKAARFTASPVDMAAALGAASEAADAVAEEVIAASRSQTDEVFLAAAEAGRQEEVEQSSLLHDILGNPFRPVAISPSILAWNDGLVVRLAQAVYEERHLPSGTLDTGRLAILADALEEAGYTDAVILGHLRGPGPHVRGCWPVDALLGKS